MRSCGRHRTRKHAHRRANIPPPAVYTQQASKWRSILVAHFSSSARRSRPRSGASLDACNDGLRGSSRVHSCTNKYERMTPPIPVHQKRLDHPADRRRAVLRLTKDNSSWFQNHAGQALSDLIRSSPSPPPHPPPHTKLSLPVSTVCTRSIPGEVL